MKRILVWHLPRFKDGDSSQGPRYWSALQDSSFNIAGPDSQLSINQGSQAGSGFVAVQYVEIPSSELPA